MKKDKKGDLMLQAISEAIHCYRSPC